MFKYMTAVLQELSYRLATGIRALFLVQKQVWKLAKQQIPLKRKNRIKRLKNRRRIARRNISYPKCLLPPKLREKTITVLPCLDAGFFSIFNNYVSHLVYAEKNEIILPDWRVSNIFLGQRERLSFSNFKLVSFCYATPQDGNAFFKLFENPYPSLVDADMYETDRMYHFADKILPYMDYNEEKEPNLTALNSYNLYNDANYFPVFRKKYHEILQKYIHLKPEIEQKITQFSEQNLRGYFVVSAFIRCKGHALELKETSPGIELWEKNLLEILKENNIPVSSDRWRFFVASDNEDAVNFFSGKYPKNVVFQNMQRLTPEQEKEYEAKKKELGHDTWGYELQHRKASDASQHSLQNAIDVIFDVYTAASADYLIYTNSNMSTAASYINPKVKMVYCK